jgi:hypothetical protein
MSMTRNSISSILLAAAAAFALAVPAVAMTGSAHAFPTAPAEPGPEAAAGPIPGIAEGSPPPSPEQLAQYSPVPPRGRPVSDHDHARDTARAGENRGFDELMRSAQSRGRGEYLGVEPDISRNVYRFKFLRSGGNVVWVDVDGRTGRVIAERD